jgi:hypothetical protein
LGPGEAAAAQDTKMSLVIPPSARDDITDGFEFYENQQDGPGAYFREFLFSDIESLVVYAGIHLKVSGFYRLLSKRFLTQFITTSKAKTYVSGPYWIAGGILFSFVADSGNLAVKDCC